MSPKSAFISVYQRPIILLFFLLTNLALAGTAPISGENLRITALQTIFPGMQISLIPGQLISGSRRLKRGPQELDSPDALVKENVYRVIGKATKEVEKEASVNIISGPSSSTRLLRFQLFHWPHSAGLLAVLQYKFDGANPSMACPSIGRLVQLAQEGESWSTTFPCSPSGCWISMPTAPTNSWLSRTSAARRHGVLIY